jgi:pimeloyl-ACP methyl ester carboxylesterase
VLVDYPGAGKVPHDPLVRSFDDLVTIVLRLMDRPVHLVAQSMGGVVALQASLRRPKMVGRMVLCATSGGVDLRAFGVADWREQYRHDFPAAAEWLLTYRVDLSDRLAALRVPTLLLWSDADAISPVAVGEHLVRRLADASLVVVKGGDHMFARDRADEVAPHIERHLLGARP